MSIYINGFDRKSTMKQIKAKNLGYISSDEFGNCLYRSGDGNCCLVGCFIPDEKYCDSIENRDAYHVIQTLNLEDNIPFHQGYMMELQEFHDNIEDFMEDLSSSKEFFNLIENKLIELEQKNK